MTRGAGMLLPVLLSVLCNHIVVPQIPYEPEIVFTGYFNNTYQRLEGNWQWPNSCELVGDTVRIYCYSTFFGESNRIRNGDLMRIDLFPDSVDGFQKRNILFHLARYYEKNESYTINRGDTIDNSIRFESRRLSFSRTVGGEVDLDMIYVVTPPVKNGQLLQIVDGHLFGSIHHP